LETANIIGAVRKLTAAFRNQKAGESQSLEFTFKPVMVILQLMAKAYCHHDACTALALKKKKKFGELLVDHCCTRANDNKSQMKKSSWHGGLDIHQSPEIQVRRGSIPTEGTIFL
jgi:hypothetical protein